MVSLGPWVLRLGSCGSPGLSCPPGPPGSSDSRGSLRLECVALLVYLVHVVNLVILALMFQFVDVVLLTHFVLLVIRFS